ncbi:MAG: diacylglycerol/polyprenol kinase family protein [Candidatus Thorarchaeota archaeon]
MQLDINVLMGDIVVYFIALLYVLAVLTIGDFLRRKMNLGSDFTRKVIHLFAGASVWTVPYYPHPWVATLVAFTFVVFLVLAGTDRFSRYFEAMARPEDLEHGSVRGPFWYAVSITLITGIFTFTGYERIYFVGAAAIHIMMLGDGMSAPIGMRYGKNHTRVIFGSNRSLHGSLALFAFGFLGCVISFWFFGIAHYGAFVSGGQILWTPLLIMSLVGATSATLIELVSPKGTDNTTVPLLTTVILFVTGMLLGVVTL